MTDDLKPRRLTRAESKELTRNRLLDAAAQTFARRGYAAASVEEIAEAAGFSIGAVYSNFGSKDELFSALMHDRSNNQIGDIGAIIETANAQSTDPFTALGQMLIAIADKDIETAVLRTEFWLHAVRNPELMQIEASASDNTLEAVRGILSDLLDRNGVDVSAVPVDDFAITTVALFSGLIRQRRIDPARVSEAMFGQALRWQIAGMPKKNEEH